MVGNDSINSSLFLLYIILLSSIILLTIASVNGIRWQDMLYGKSLPLVIIVYVKVLNAYCAPKKALKWNKFNVQIVWTRPKLVLYSNYHNVGFGQTFGL